MLMTLSKLAIGRACARLSPGHNSNWNGSLASGRSPATRGPAQAQPPPRIPRRCAQSRIRRRSPRPTPCHFSRSSHAAQRVVLIAPVQREHTSAVSIYGLPVHCELRPFWNTDWGNTAGSSDPVEQIGKPCSHLLVRVRLNQPGFALVPHATHFLILRMPGPQHIFQFFFRLRMDPTAGLLQQLATTPALPPTARIGRLEPRYSNSFPVCCPTSRASDQHSISNT